MLIFLFASPSITLLIVPERRGNWPAGGASIWLPGTEDELWPPRLFGDATGWPHCAFPTPQRLTLGAPKGDSCIWAGVSLIGERFKKFRFTGVIELPISDRVLRREWGAGFMGAPENAEQPIPETRVSTVHIPVGLMLKNAGQIWFQTLLQVPTSTDLTGPNTTAVFFTCSVDARWAKASFTGSPIDSFNGHYVQKADVLHERRYPPSFTGWEYSNLPVNDGSWRKVRIDIDWLEALTPSVDNNTSGYTSLAALLNDLDIVNHTDTDATPTLEGIIAALVANGMSRTNFGSIGKAPLQLEDPSNILPYESTSQWERFMKGSYSFPRPVGPAVEMKLSVTVEGNAYHADSKAYGLALAVLLLHATLAIGHSIYVVPTVVTEANVDGKEKSNGSNKNAIEMEGFPQGVLERLVGYITP
ncbi:MAG: hypothetical protein Q9170_001923 [Blastenia crenularia]